MKRSTVLVTGASAGIGEAAARRLAKAGHLVYPGTRGVNRLKALEPEGSRALSLDVTDDASMRAAVERIEQEAGGVDVLINNAGYGSLGALEDRSATAVRGQRLRPSERRAVVLAIRIDSDPVADGVGNPNGIEAHVNLVMRKPFKIDALLAAVEALVATSPTAPP